MGRKREDIEGLRVENYWSWRRSMRHGVTISLVDWRLDRSCAHHIWPHREPEHPGVSYWRTWKGS